MAKFSALDELIQELDAIATHLADITIALKDLCSTPSEAPQEVTDTPVAIKTYTKEEVRQIMVAKCSEASGAYKADVKALIRKYAEGGNLSAIPADQYNALVYDLEVMGHG